jgi:ribosome biogenesis GTPase
VDRYEKDKQVERYLRSAHKFIGYEEEKRRKASSRERKGSTKARGPRRQDWSAGEDAWDDEVSHEKIERRKKGAVRQAASARVFDESLPRATVVAVHRGRVELDGGREARLATHLVTDPTFQVAVGDEVGISETGGVARIEGLAPRRTWLARSDPGNASRELVIAANVDIAVVVAAAVDPPLRPGLIDRFLLGLERGGVQPAVCINKVDRLGDERERARVSTLVEPYVQLGLAVVWCSAVAREGLDELAALLAGRTCVFVGHSGVGKSSILNALDPNGERATGDVREFDGRGRHTTTSSSLRELPGGARLIDTPGVRSFGIEHLDLADVRAGFPDLAEYGAACRFADCTHVHEPDCGVRVAVDEGRLSAARVASYQRIVHEL